MIRKLFFLAASLVIGLPLYATLTPAVTFSGHIKLSTDALGTNESAGGPIRFSKPTNNSTVRAAYLLAASTGFTEFVIPDNRVVLKGTPIVWDPTKTIANGIESYNHWADVTNILRGPLNGAVAGIGSFVFSEGSAFSRCRPHRMAASRLPRLHSMPSPAAPARSRLCCLPVDCRMKTATTSRATSPW